MPGGAGVVGDNGEVYLSGLDETGQLKVQWGRNTERSPHNFPKT
ncbi:FimD/PapC C-terminal domain-containing protein [Escherichia coli]|nr:FimD/PapC C-terminal domain-containing protein [Escherichia coli]